VKASRECAPSLRVRGVVRSLAVPVAWLLIAALPAHAIPVVPGRQVINEQEVKVINEQEVNGVLEGLHPQTPSSLALGIGGGGSGHGTRARRERARVVGVRVVVVALSRQKVGNFTLSFVDLEVPVSGLPIRVTRSYDSRDKRPGDFGIGWRLELSDVRVEESEAAGLAWQGTVSPGFFANYCLASAAPPVVTLTLPDGRVLDFQMRLTPTCQPFLPIESARVSYVPIGTTLGTLAPAGGADVYVVGSWPGPVELYDASSFALFDPALYRYTSPDGRVFVVHDSEGLKSLTDLNGNRLTVTPAGITHSSGKGVTFTRDGSGRITAVTDPGGQTIEYGYDGNGDLVSHTDREDNTTRFGYHAEILHHLVTIEDPLGRHPIRNEYDASGRLLRHVDAFGKTIEYTHQLGIRREIVTDRNLKQRVLDYDERGNVLQETDPSGKVVLRTYDARNNRLSETLPHDPGTVNPPTTTYTYDGADNVLSVYCPRVRIG